MIWGAFNIYAGLITYGTLTAVLSLIAQIQGPISGLSSIIPQYYTAAASAERIMEVEEIKDEEDEKDIVNDKVEAFAEFLNISEYEVTKAKKDRYKYSYKLGTNIQFSFYFFLRFQN